MGEKRNPVEEILTKLSKYPFLRYESSDEHVSVEAHDDAGFSVGFYVEGFGFSVHFEGWHEHFQIEQQDEALNCFAFGLSDECRMKVFSRGRSDYKWTLESLENGIWRADSTVGKLLFPFWRRKKIRYLQNRVLKNEVESEN